MHHIFVDENQIVDNKVIIDQGYDFLNYNHLRNALRIKVKEKVLISINSVTLSYDYLCEVVKINSDDIVLNILEKCSTNEIDITINLYQGLPKFDKMEYIIEKSVELGVSTIVPVAMSNCVVRLDDKKAQGKIDRWNKISLSAATQSKRGIIPNVANVISFDDMLKNIGQSENAYLLYENASRETIVELEQLSKISNSINIIVGPEGGFTDSEIKKVKNSNIKLLTLGKRILRTETAAIALLSFIMLNNELKNQKGL